MKIDMKQVRDLMRALKQFEMSEVEVRDGEARIRIRREPDREPGVTLATNGLSVAPPAPSPAPPPAAPAADADAGIVYVTSPFVGTFYRAPSPGASAFVSAGQVVEAGQVLCIVEAMKLMNEIEAEQGGTIVEVLAENGKPVEYGDRLFKLRAS